MNKLTDSLLAIDPGVEGAWAYWHADETLAPLRYALITPKADTWESRVATFWDELAIVIRTHDPSVVACEYPLFIDTAAGQLTARRGDLVKLVYVVGGIGRICQSYQIPFRLVPVNEWKGQMSKSNVERRIKRLLGGVDLGFKSHVWDAVGIGMYVRGDF